MRLGQTIVAAEQDVEFQPVFPQNGRQAHATVPRDHRRRQAVLGNEIQQFQTAAVQRRILGRMFFMAVENRIALGPPGVVHLSQRFEDRAVADVHLRFDHGKVEHRLGKRAVHVEEQPARRAGEIAAEIVAEITTEITAEMVGWTQRFIRLSGTTDRMRFACRNLMLMAVSLLVFGSPARADWFNAAWPFRRTLTVAWDAEHQGDDGEIAVADFYTAGHTLADGNDIRVVTKEGRICPTRVLKLGPGDTARIVFNLIKLETEYAVYWGNPKPDPLPANVSTDVPIRFGVLFESRGLGNGNGDSFKNLERAWQTGKPDFGGDMIERPFIGYDPCTTADRTVDRLTGSIFAPVDGDYEFAGACDDAGALYLDGKPLLLIPGCFADTRFNQTINLTRGRHDFLMYHVNYAGPMVISLGWKRPDTAKVEIIGRENFGICARGMPGDLEQLKQSLVPDFTVEHIAETFEHEPGTREPERGNYSQLYRFKARLPHENSSLKILWDFGDGQTATGESQDHVFLTEGVYPIKLTYQFGENAQAQTNRVLVERDQTQTDHPQTNDPPIQSRIVAGYNVDTLPVRWLPWATMLHFKANDNGAMTAVADRLAGEPKHPDANLAFATLNEITQAGDAAQATALWQNVPVTSDLQPRAVKLLTELLLWNDANFTATVDALTPFANRKDGGIGRRRAQALLLSGKVDEARKLFATLHNNDPADRAAAMSGAMARTVEYFLTEKDAQAGSEAWEQWQTRFPDSFLEGYSVLLRVKLMSLDRRNAAAAKVAEAFALAVPTSSYSPQLLDQASKLLATVDPAKSASLHQMLKDRYPEDPLSQ